MNTLFLDGVITKKPFETSAGSTTKVQFEMVNVEEYGETRKEYYFDINVFGKVKDSVKGLNVGDVVVVQGKIGGWRSEHNGKTYNNPSLQALSIVSVGSREIQPEDINIPF